MVCTQMSIAAERIRKINIAQEIQYNSKLSQLSTAIMNRTGQNTNFCRNVLSILAYGLIWRVVFENAIHFSKLALAFELHFLRKLLF